MALFSSTTKVTEWWTDKASSTLLNGYRISPCEVMGKTVSTPLNTYHCIAHKPASTTVGWVTLHRPTKPFNAVVADVHAASYTRVEGNAYWA